MSNPENEYKSFDDRPDIWLEKYEEEQHVEETDIEIEDQLEQEDVKVFVDLFDIITELENEARNKA